MRGDGEDGDALRQINMLSTLPSQLNPPRMGGEIGSTTLTNQRKDDRFSQWSSQETRDFIAIRAELEKDFTSTKRNKTLWEMVSAKMKERGYRRSSEQCKCKWKNLVNRYKGKETTDPESGRPCPFFDELHSIFTERAKNMQKMMSETEDGSSQSKKKMKRVSGDRSSDDFTEDDDMDEEESEDEQQEQFHGRNRKRKTERSKSRPAFSVVSGNSNVYELLQEFMQQQQRMEIQWREMIERRAEERRAFEQEWRKTMVSIERERLIAEQKWREREEQRRIREESRTEKRDALLTTLINKLLRGDI